MTRDMMRSMAAEHGFVLPPRMNGQPAFADFGSIGASTLFSAGASVFGGLMQAEAAGDAAAAQQSSADQSAQVQREALAENRRQYDLAREDTAAARGIGADAIGQLRNLLGVGVTPRTRSQISSGIYSALGQSLGARRLTAQQAAAQARADLGANATPQQIQARTDQLMQFGGFQFTPEQLQVVNDRINDVVARDSRIGEFFTDVPYEGPGAMPEDAALPTYQGPGAFRRPGAVIDGSSGQVVGTVGDMFSDPRLQSRGGVTQQNMGADRELAGQRANMSFAGSSTGSRDGSIMDSLMSRNLVQEGLVQQQQGNGGLGLLMQDAGSSFAGGADPRAQFDSTGAARTDTFADTLRGINPGDYEALRGALVGEQSRLRAAGQDAPDITDGMVNTYAAGIRGGGNIGDLLVSSGFRQGPQAASQGAQGTMRAAGMEPAATMRLSDLSRPYETLPGFSLNPAPTSTAYTPTAFNFQADPGYEFRKNEGIRAVENNLTAGGKGMLGGNAIRAAAEYASNLASDEYDRSYGRWLERDRTGYDRWLERDRTGYDRWQGEEDRRYSRSADDYNRAFTEYLNANDIANQAFDRDLNLSNLATGRAWNRYATRAGESTDRYNRALGERNSRMGTLSSLAGFGTGVTNNLNQVGQQNANTAAGIAGSIGNLYTSAGNARGASILAGSNAMGTGFANAGNTLMLNDLLRRNLTNNTRSVYSNTGYGSEP